VVERDTRSKLLAVAMSAASTAVFLFQREKHWGPFLYFGLGFLVTAIWYWKDRSPCRGNFVGVFIASPIMALLWPILLFTIPWTAKNQTPASQNSGAGATISSTTNRAN